MGSSEMGGRRKGLPDTSMSGGAGFPANHLTAHTPADRYRAYPKRRP